MFKALKYILVKVFDSNNVIAPIKFLLKLILGRDLMSGSRDTRIRA